MFAPPITGNLNKDGHSVSPCPVFGPLERRRINTGDGEGAIDPQGISVPMSLIPPSTPNEFGGAWGRGSCSLTEHDQARETRGVGIPTYPRGAAPAPPPSPLPCLHLPDPSMVRRVAYKPNAAALGPSPRGIQEG